MLKMILLAAAALLFLRLLAGLLPAMWRPIALVVKPLCIVGLLLTGAFGGLAAWRPGSGLRLAHGGWRLQGP